MFVFIACKLPCERSEFLASMQMDIPSLNLHVNANDNLNIATGRTRFFARTSSHPGIIFNRLSTSTVCVFVIMELWCLASNYSALRDEILFILDNPDEWIAGIADKCCNTLSLGR